MHRSNLVVSLLALLPAVYSLASLSDFYRLTTYANLITRKAQQPLSGCESNEGSTCVALDEVIPSLYTLFGLSC